MLRPRIKRTWEVAVRHLYFVGPGLVSSVAYIDPGNWATDLQAGAQYGYKLLFVVLLAGFAAVVLQLLAVRLGATTALSLPTQTRLLFIRLQQKYPRFRRPLQLALYVLYGLAEIAIIGTDLAELLGSATALNLLFPRLPLYGGVLITAADVLIILVFFRSSTGRQGMLFFEIVIVSLVLAVFVSFMVLLHLVKPDWREVFLGLVPSKTLVKPGALYVGVGIIGATVMPHALFLGSSLASEDRLNMLPVPPSDRPKPRRSFKLPAINAWSRLRRRTTRRSGIDSLNTDLELRHSLSASSAFDLPSTSLSRAESAQETKPGGARNQDKTEPEQALTNYEAEVRSFDRIAWVDVHLFHATIDTTLSLLGFALTINAAILTLAGAAFFYNHDVESSDATLQGAHTLVKSFLGNGAALIFALALLCAGQSASITATLAGQIVSEGFINWKTSPFARRAVTRLIGVVPATIVAAAVGNQGLNTMLVASQVLLSIVLPTVIFPLVYLCSREDLMTVCGPEVEAELYPGGEDLGRGRREAADLGCGPLEAAGVGREPEAAGVGREPLEAADLEHGPLEAADVEHGPLGVADVDVHTALGRSLVPTAVVPAECGQGGVLVQAQAGPSTEPRVELEPHGHGLDGNKGLYGGDVPDGSGGRCGRDGGDRPDGRDGGDGRCGRDCNGGGDTRRERRIKSYKSPMWVTVLGYTLFGVVVLANGYVIVELALGQ